MEPNQPGECPRGKYDLRPILPSLVVSLKARRRPVGNYKTKNGTGTREDKKKTDKTVVEHCRLWTGAPFDNTKKDFIKNTHKITLAVRNRVRVVMTQTTRRAHTKRVS